ncbi:uncharacterized protein LOC131310038 isoform X2 [Rhododendron vialii]|uniref:uncharacterized protein LOC131310038 isoform X2 n=1 Tax=Rhododendron vialii TaxID=182163 RepID=UPI00265FE148|nr:uncharacterized protein LOC131310038 isoform X2 [Rhododendron vialii]
MVGQSVDSFGSRSTAHVLMGIVNWHSSGDGLRCILVVEVVEMVTSVKLGFKLRVVEEEEEMGRNVTSGSFPVSKLVGAVNIVLNGINIVIVLTSPQTTGISVLIMEGRLELGSSEMKKVFSTWRALVEVMEALSKDAAPDGVGRLIVEEIRKIKKSDAPLAGELTPYNIVPLEAPSLTNAIGFFPEHCQTRIYLQCIYSLLLLLYT